MYINISGWLLLADIYINSTKYEQAEELLKQCMLHNQVKWGALLFEIITHKITPKITKNNQK